MPLRPKRRAAAVKKSLRSALAASTLLQSSVDAADARSAAKARSAVRELEEHAKRLTQLTAELRLAVEREINYHLWRRGKAYVD